MGDFGTGKREQYQLGEQMARVRAQFPFELMITVGDNLYGGNEPKDFVKKFETPYKALLDARREVLRLARQPRLAPAEPLRARSTWTASTYYTFKAPKQDVRFFALESDYLDPAQLQWLRARAARARATTGRFPTSTTRSIPRAAGTARTCPSARCSSRCSSSTASASCSPGTTTSTSGSSRSRGSCISWSARAVSCGRATWTSSTGFTAVGQRHRAGVPGRGDRRRRAVLQRRLAHRQGDRLGRDRAAQAAVNG